MIKLVGKVMGTVFWDANGIICIDYLEKGRSIYGKYYASFSNLVGKEIKKKHPHLAEKKVVEACFEELPKFYILEKLENRWARCIELQRDYVEK